MYVLLCLVFPGYAEDTRVISGAIQAATVTAVVVSVVLTAAVAHAVTTTVAVMLVKFATRISVVRDSAVWLDGARNCLSYLCMPQCRIRHPLPPRLLPLPHLACRSHGLLHLLRTRLST